MDNGIDKKALFRLKVEPYLKPISDLGVGFYNLDENTAKIEFQLYNSKGTLQISENNIDAYAYFESANGSVSDVIDLEVLDGLNGIVGITLDKEFLQASTDTKVTGQVYIGVNNVSGKPEYNEVAVFREFDFEVKDALINKISSFTKIEYIRMFDQLKARIEQQVKDIEEAIAKGADYVAEMKSVLQKGIETLNAIVADGKTDIQSFITQTKSDLNNTKDDAINEINGISNNTKTSVNETADGAIKNINNVSTDTIEYIDVKVDEFNSLLETEGFMTSDKLNDQLEELEWQKHKITEDNGYMKELERPDLARLDDYFNKTELVYVSTPRNSPHGVGYSGFINAIFREGGYGLIFFQPYNSSSIYQNRRVGNRWEGWKQITNTQTDTGWVAFSLINGAESNTAYKEVEENGFDCAYRVINNKKILRLNGSNVTHGQVIAQLPFEFCKQTQTFPITISSDFNGAFIVIKPSGEIEFYIQGDKTSWGEENTIYGEVSWVE